MALIPWRKLQAGFSGKSDSATLQTVLQAFQGGTTAGGNLELDTLIVNNIIIRRRAKAPVGVDKFS